MCHTQVPMGWMKRSIPYQPLPTICPKFCQDNVMVNGKTFEIFHWNVLDCITEIYSCHHLTPHLKFKPEWHYADGDMTVWIYGDMHTGKWWWEVQVSKNLRTEMLACNSPQPQKAVEKETPGATIIPVHISSDKTLITSFLGKLVYPVIGHDFHSSFSVHFWPNFTFLYWLTFLFLCLSFLCFFALMTYNKDTIRLATTSQ